MAKHRAGLHREISSIFDGVPIPNNNGIEQSSCTTTHEDTGYIAAEHPEPQLTEPQQSEQSPPKANDVKQPKDISAAKNQIQIWLQQYWQQYGQQYWQQISSKLLAPKPGVDPKRQKAMLILVPVLFVGLIFVLFKVFDTPNRRKINPPKSSLVATTIGSGTKIDWKIPDPYPTTLRDPTQMGSAKTSQFGTGAIIVKGIVYSPDDPAAIIGTQIAKEGDKISGVTVLKISRDSVEFELNGKTWTQNVQR